MVTFPSNDSIIKLWALLPDASMMPAQVFSVYGMVAPLRPNMSKNSDLASETLLWSSKMTYIFCHSSWWPFGYTFTRQIFEQDFP